MYAQLPISVNVKKALGRIKDIRRRLSIIQSEFDIDAPMYINSFYSPLIELWTHSGRIP